MTMISQLLAFDMKHCRVSLMTNFEIQASFTILAHVSSTQACNANSLFHKKIYLFLVLH